MQPFLLEKKAGSGRFHLLRRDMRAQLDLAVVLVHEHQLRLVRGDFAGFQLHEGSDDYQVALGGTARGRAVHGNHAAATLALDGVGGEAFAVVDVPDVDLLEFADAGSFQQVFVDGAGAFVVQFAVGNGGAMDLAIL
jgi:hypothetical protein